MQPGETRKCHFLHHVYNPLTYGKIKKKLLHNAHLIWICLKMTKWKSNSGHSGRDDFYLKAVENKHTFFI